MTLWEVSRHLSSRLIGVFAKNDEGKRAVNGKENFFSTKEDWTNLVPFYEYFHGDDGAGLGASHQTGWTALVAKLIQQSGKPTSAPRT